MVRYAKLNENAKAPFRKNPTDAGLDFYSLEDVVVPAHSMKILHTGITIEIPRGYCLLMKPKSRNNHLVGAGIIDAYYEPGEVLVKVVNISDNELKINAGDGIAQGVFISIYTPEIEEVEVSHLINMSSRSVSGGILTQSKQ